MHYPEIVNNNWMIIVREWCMIVFGCEVSYAEKLLIDYFHVVIIKRCFFGLSITWKVNAILSCNDIVWGNDSFIPLFSSLLFKSHPNTFSHDFRVLVGNAFNCAVVNCLALTFRGTVCTSLWWEFGPLSRYTNYKIVSAIWWTELHCFIWNKQQKRLEQLHT